jgi:hypothetical protein
MMLCGFEYKCSDFSHAHAQLFLSKFSDLLLLEVVSSKVQEGRNCALRFCALSLP